MRSSLTTGLSAVFLAGVALTLFANAQAAQRRNPTENPIHAYLQPLVDNHTLAGAVTLVATKNEFIDMEAVGYSDLAGRVAMRPDSIFWIASTTKPMTVTALMMLVDQGKVSLDDPVEKYLPEFHDQLVNSVMQPVQGTGERKFVPASHPIRVREILCHTSGLRFRSGAQPGALDLLPLEDAVHSYEKEPLTFQPGTSFSYSNEGIGIAARILEVVSGMPYETFMQERLFDPLGMKDTSFWPNSEQILRLARSYRLDAKPGELVETPIDQLTYPLNDRKHRFPIPAGGLFSTASDVAKFAQMILNGGIVGGKRIVSESAIREMTRAQNGGMGGRNYGLGWFLQPNGFGHPGAYNNTVEINPETGRILIFMVQQKGAYGTSEGKGILPALERLADDLVVQHAAIDHYAAASRR